MLKVGTGGKMQIKWLAIATFLTGCDTGSSMVLGQFGEEDQLECEATSVTPVSPGDTVEIGYADDLKQVDVDAMLALATGLFEETLEWSDGTQADVAGTFADAGSPEFVVTEDVGNGPESEPGPCPTQLRFTVTVGLTTSDGRMADDFTAEASTLGERIYFEHRITNPGGTIDVQALAAPGVQVEPDEVRVGLWLADGTFGGQLVPQPIGGIDDDAAPLAVWPFGELETE